MSPGRSFYRTNVFFESLLLLLLLLLLLFFRFVPWNTRRKSFPIQSLSARFLPLLVIASETTGRPPFSPKSTYQGRRESPASTQAFNCDFADGSAAASIVGEFETQKGTLRNGCCSASRTPTRNLEFLLSLSQRKEKGKRETHRQKKSS